jgi:hypothetical protein
MSLPLLVPNKILFHCPRALMSKGSKKKAVRQFSTVSGLEENYSRVVINAQHRIDCIA